MTTFYVPSERATEARTALSSCPGTPTVRWVNLSTQTRLGHADEQLVERVKDSPRLSLNRSVQRLLDRAGLMIVFHEPRSAMLFKLTFGGA